MPVRPTAGTPHATSAATSSVFAVPASTDTTTSSVALSVMRRPSTFFGVIARLSDQFAHDALDVDEFERRVTVAQTSDDPADIEALLSDLPDTGGAPAPTTKGFIAFEPMVGITNALNLAHKGIYKDLQSVPPGGSWEESFWVTTKGF